jgi:hypothetical protein
MAHEEKMSQIKGTVTGHTTAFGFLVCYLMMLSVTKIMQHRWKMNE